ncbi:hypothetical protein VRK_05890 [Vibrio sp. MEBiC08052]|nr:hypothetical protein VRK_05890 [Vibrio sp. MEBiC08052]
MSDDSSHHDMDGYTGFILLFLLFFQRNRSCCVDKNGDGGSLFNVTMRLILVNQIKIVSVMIIDLIY